MHPLRGEAIQQAPKYVGRIASDPVGDQYSRRFTWWNVQDITWRLGNEAQTSGLEMWTLSKVLFLIKETI